jgi:tetratricopeptide (TPR) repeat protein
MADPFSGRTFDQYEVLEKLGGGGMGIVYRARDTKLGRQVALKFLPPQWAHDEDAKQRFVREAQAASATDHRNICTIHDVGTTDDGHLFLVMALYEGPTLKRRLQQGPLSVDEALEIAMQVADGLAKAHAAGVVHRDVKPGNLILTEDAVKIVDFGLATFSSALQLTLEGTTLGTAAYMSPEQSRGEDVDPATDVWAAGVILYEMLAGHPPFRGASADAITYAIRHDAPTSLRAIRPEVSEEVEHVVFRALMKEPRLRFPTGRELARAIRQARGHTMPQDLLTQAIALPPSLQPGARQPLPLMAPAATRRRVRPVTIAAAGLLLIASAGVGWWAYQPGERMPILVAPLANQTGEAALDGYRLALTHAMVRALSESPAVRPVPYPKMLQVLRRFQGSGGADVGSREALQALEASAGTKTVLMPALIYDDRDRTWRGRVELRNAVTATAADAYETGRVTSALSKETAHELSRQMVELVNQHLSGGGVRAWLRRADPVGLLASIEAEKAFESGISWYEEQEYSSALGAFEAAAGMDRQNPLLHAWVSRAALVMRRDDVARDAAERAASLLSNRTSATDRLFIEAAVAEARREPDTAESRLRQLVDDNPDDVSWRIELAAFHDRRADSRDAWMVAVNDYHDVLTRDPGLLRPRLELCRLYNRLQEPANAKRQGEEALNGYQRAGWRGGEALVRFCLVDALRAGSAVEQRQARAHAEAALSALQALRFQYNVPRAVNNVALAAAEQGRFSEAIALWEAGATAAEEGQNALILPTILGNLGVAQSRVANVDGALAAYRRSAELYERLGDERRAAQQQANGGLLGIAYGLDIPAAVRDLQNARAVLQRVGDADWEVASLEGLATYYRNEARYEDAERELSRALALAKERNLRTKIVSVSLAQARVSFDRDDYATALSRLLELSKVLDGGRSAVLTLLARVHLRLGDPRAADADLREAEASLPSRDGTDLPPALDVAKGELAFEQGRLAEARQFWQKVVSRARSVDELVVWGRMRLALLDGIQGQPARARATLETAIQEARRLGRLSLEVTARIAFARIALLEGKRDEGQRVLAAVGDDEARLGLETRAMLHYLRGQLAGDGPGRSDIETARRLLDELQKSIPETYRKGFVSRKEIQVVAG